MKMCQKKVNAVYLIERGHPSTVCCIFYGFADTPRETWSQTEGKVIDALSKTPDTQYGSVH